MVNLVYILFICIVAPMSLLLLMLRKKAKLIVGYMIIGIFVSLFISELNTVLLRAFDNDVLYVTTTITPVSEEIVKAIPVLFYAIVFSDRKDRVFPIAFSLGIGFGMFENMVILVQNIEGVSISWAIIRGFSTALMHGVCTLAIGYGICFAKKKKKLFFSGIFALLTLASIYHGIFNMLVQSDYKYLGFVLPALTYIPMIIQQYNYAKKKELKAKKI